MENTGIMQPILSRFKENFHVQFGTKLNARVLSIGIHADLLWPNVYLNQFYFECIALNSIFRKIIAFSVNKLQFCGNLLGGKTFGEAQNRKKMFGRM
jgi:hypothetical protein